MSCNKQHAETFKTPAGVSLSCLKGVPLVPLKTESKIPIYPRSKSRTKGTWSNRLLVMAALVRPAMVGWSGILARKMSRWFLNRGKSAEFSFLRDFGRRLNNLAPWTFRKFSLAFFTSEGALLGMLAGTASLPLLSLHCHLVSNPLTRPWESFQMKQIW